MITMQFSLIMVLLFVLTGLSIALMLTTGAKVHYNDIKDKWHIIVPIALWVLGIYIGVTFSMAII